jgi:XRE family transcriptional regulator of biofilm formation
MNNKEIGARVRELRKREGLSMQELADRASCYKAQIFVLENGSLKNPPIIRLKKISSIFSVSLMYLINGENKRFIKINRDDYTASNLSILSKLISSLRIINKS